MSDIADEMPDVSSTTVDEDDQEDGCDIDFKQGPQATDEEVEVMPLFADALDPNSPVTVGQAGAEWRELFDGVPPGDS